MTKINIIAIVVYIASIVIANLLVASYGPSVVVINAFVLIGLDLVLRDYLHDSWSMHRTRNMTALITAAGILSYAFNPAAAQIAIASTVAFMLAAIADWVTYSMVHHWSFLARSNTSNVVGAAVDSIVFPALAFGLPLMIPIVAGQFVAKTLGGVLWSSVIYGGRSVSTHYKRVPNDA